MDRLKTGVVSNFVNEKNFGFIRDMETNKEYFFFLDKKEQIQLRKEGNFAIAHIRKGDVLKFNTRISRKNNQEEAHNLIFINNPYVDLIKSDIEKTGVRLGLINVINEEYYVRDKEFGILFPVKILHSEKGFLDVDFMNTEPTVEYILEQRKNPTKIYAKLTMQLSKVRVV
jgi:cold shock CspA family protein